MDINTMTIEQMEARMAEITAAIDTASAEEIDGYTEEVRQINARREELRAAEAAREELRKAVAGGAGTVTRTFAPQQKQERTYGANSEEYRRAWLKDMATRTSGNVTEHLLGAMTAEERTAFTFTTENTGSVVPTPIMNRIIELVEHNAPMYADANKPGMSQGFSVPRHKATTQGKAKGAKEGKANDDSSDEFDLLTLSGIEIKKHVVLSRKMKFKSIPAFEDWIVSNIAAEIGDAKEAAIVARLSGAAAEDGSTVTEAGIDPANKLVSQKYDDATISGIFGKMKGKGSRVVYANSTTIWSHLALITGADGKKLFVPDSMGDPIVQGRIYGAVIKQDDSLPDNDVYFGRPSQLMANDYCDVEIFSTIEAKTVNDVKTGYVLFDAALENPKSWVKAAFTVGG